MQRTRTEKMRARGIDNEKVLAPYYSYSRGTCESSILPSKEEGT